MNVSRWPEGVPVTRLLGKDLFPFAALVAGLPVLALRISVEHSVAGFVGAPACMAGMMVSWELLCRLARRADPR
jgi:hypothetical protein